MTPAIAHVNIRGQVVFLEATREHWPQLLSSMPWQQWCRAASHARPETFREMQNAIVYEKNCDELEMWADKHGIRDRWIWDAAVQTLMKTPAGSVPTRWLYETPELPIDPLAVTIGHWIPGFFAWREFKKSALADFARKMEKYRRSRIKIWGSNRPAMMQQAAWTVLWQRGKTAEQIRTQYPQLHTGKISADGILMGIRSFSSSIGLSPREGRSGPRRRT